MSTLFVLAAVYLAGIGAVGAVWGALHVARRDGAELGSLRPHFLVHAATRAGVRGAAVAALVAQGLRPYALALALALYIAGRVHFAWMKRHDDTDPGPPLSRAQVERLAAARRRVRLLGLTSVLLTVTIVPMVWLTLGWAWGIALLATG